MSIEWFRWYHSTVSDPKFSACARKAKQPKSAVIAVWAALLECASQAPERGDISGFDPETISVALDLDEDAIHDILAAITAKGLIVNNLVSDRRIFQTTQLPSYWKSLRVLIFERDGYICQYCGISVDSPHCDHVFPRSRGGSDEIENLVTACPRCNISKKDRTPEEWKP